ncbi:MAG: PqqD family protein [Thaumarchaeota archaeon]|nr:PqqD family protein [Nitrososphaerota archaeon]
MSERRGSGQGERPPSRNSGVLSREAEDWVFLFNTSSNELFRVNATGGRIWDLLGKGQSAEEMAVTISGEFEGSDLGRVRTGVLAFLKELSKRELIEL